MLAIIDDDPTGAQAQADVPLMVSWDRELLMELSPQWQALGYVHDNGPGGPMTVDDAAAAVLAALTSPVWLRDLTAVSDPGRANATF